MKESSAVIHVQIPVDVAAFLLNEKRGEIMKIEARHKVEIVLIPNKYLETPHYKLERIKHDDPRLEEPQLSYKLAEQSDIDMSFSKRQKEPARPSQEAVVKNIPEGMPAPVVDHSLAPAEAEKGFFDRLLGFFGIGKTEAVQEEPVEKQPAKNVRKGKNGERSRNRGRRGEPREDRSKSVQPAVSSAEQEETVAASPKNTRQRRTRGEKGERQREDRRPAKSEEDSIKQEAPVTTVAARPEVTALVPVTEAVQIVSAETEGVTEMPDPERAAGTDEETRRRRRRGGRGRSRRDVNAEVAVEQAEMEASASPAEAEVPAVEPVVESVAKETAEETDAVKPAGEAVEAGEENAVPARREGRRSHPRRRRSTASSAAGSNAEAEVADATAVEEMEKDSAAGIPTEPGVPEEVEKQEESVSESNVEEIKTAETEQPAVTEQLAEEAKPEEVGLAGETDVEPAVETVEVDDSTKVHFYSEKLIEVETVSVEPSVAEAAPDPAAELDRILAEAGLTMASTDPEKLKKVQESGSQPEVEPVRRPVRRRRAPVVVDEGPLIQVDTRKE